MSARRRRTQVGARTAPKPADGAARYRYTPVGAPFGHVLVAVGPRGVVRIELASDEDAFLARLRRDLGPNVRRDDAGLSRVRRELESYLDGRARRLDLEADLSTLAPFQRRVLEALRRVPFGRVVSYGELARRAGKPRAARAVGQALGANPIPLVYPCHRVIAADGSLGGFGCGPAIKRALLALEGVTLPQSRASRGAKPPTGASRAATPRRGATP